ncbi:MAG: hypothetical protein IKQ36_03545 [Clostridia bacterium]|nr:hypothetical protein [Clostridia bacterium]
MRLHKRIVTILLLGSMLLSLICCGKSAEYLNADCFDKFMEAIAELDYAKAFEQLSRKSTTVPPLEITDGIAQVGGGASAPQPWSTPAPTAKPDEFISRSAFIEKYQNIFGALGVKSVRYEKTGEEPVNSEKRTVRYHAVYETELYGNIENDYVMTLTVEDLTWKVDWTPALIFPDMTWGSTVRINTVSARRGDILASGELLAETVMLDAVTAKLDEIPDKAAFASALAEIISADPIEIIDALDKAKSNTVLIKTMNELELTPDMHEAIDKLDGAQLIENYGMDRVYPKGSLLAHTVGYVGYVSEDELEGLNEGRTEADGLYTVHSIVGRSGIERAFETTLRGKDGLSVTVRDPAGEYVSTVYRKPVENGADVHLTIDLDLQERAEKVMDLVLWGDNTSGAVVVMQPKTGEVKALLSYPAYDLNKLAISADKDYYDVISKQKNTPLQNRTTLGLYPPGSAFKVFTASAAMEMGYVGPDYIFEGEIVDDYWTPKEYGTWVWPPIKRTKIKRREEPLNMTNAFLHSDNIYFANLALMMGEEKFFDYLRRVGMEQKFPFELSVARSTLKIRYDDPTYWNLRSIAETGYGQGQVTVSPIQLASMYCAFRNNGDMPEPHVAKALYETDGIKYAPVKEFESKTWIEDAIEPETIEALLPMMKNIMDRNMNGTGKRLRARGCTVAGKTGTAEIGSDKSREISWFVGFRVDVPEEDELLVLVVLEIPTDEEYKYIKFDIARELISMDGGADGTPIPTETDAPETTEDVND